MRGDDVEYKYAVPVSAVRTAWPATRPAHSFFKFRAYALNVLSSDLRLLDGDHPADPLIAREGRISSHFARAAGSETRTFRKSAGRLCTAPGEIAFLVMDFILHRRPIGLRSSRIGPMPPHYRLDYGTGRR